MGSRLWLGFLLIMMMFGHNFVLNQTQSLQKELMSIHDITITQFNLLYSIPSALAILFIIPMGFCYETYRFKLLSLGAICLTVGMALVTVFGAYAESIGFTMTMIGRVFEDMGAEILYLIQGNMSSSWMGSYAGVVFILPEIGEILNVFVTPWMFQNFGVTPAFAVGLFTCILSSLACFLIYLNLRKRKLRKAVTAQDIKHMEESHTQQTALRMTKIENTSSPSRDANGKGQVEEHHQDHTEQAPTLSQADSHSVLEEEPLVQSDIKTVMEAGRVFWLVIALCGLNECLYFPFLDNANQLITNRFCIAYQDTGYYLSVPFVAAMITSFLSHYLLESFSRKKLIFMISFIPLIGHGIIFLDHNCQETPSGWAQVALVVGLSFFGMGLGTYYSVSFPAVGLCVPQTIRGVAYACMGFAQTIAMTLIPIFSGQIIESEEKITTLKEGYKESSLLFVTICLLCVLISAVILCLATETSFMYDDEDQIQDSQEATSEDQGIKNGQQMKTHNGEIQSAETV